MELIRLEDIHKTYYVGEVEVPVLHGISLAIHQGEMVALMGASGSGKTTLMNILGCLAHATSGKYWLDGQEMSGLSPNQRALVRSEKIGFVFQNFNLLARTTAVQNVVMPLDYALHRPSASDARRLAETLLNRVGLAERAHHEPSQMSGGQQQRVAIARALVNRPALLLADEPTGNLDSHTTDETLRMFQGLNAEGITVVLVTHDPHVAAFAHRVVRIADGMIENDQTNSAERCMRGGGREPHFDAGSVGAMGGLRALEEADDSKQAATSVRRDGTAGAPLLEGRGLDSGAASVETSPATAAPSSDRLSEFYGGPAAARRPLVRFKLPATWRTALGALRRNKMRSGLSALGVVIAVSAVIAMTEIGQGSKAMLQKSISSMGANTLMVFAGSSATGGVSMGTGTAMTLTPEDAQEIARQCSAVADVAPMVRARAQVVYGNQNWVPEQIVGTTPSYLNVRDWRNMTEGQMFDERDVRNANKVCAIGTTVQKNLFRNESPLGKEIRVNNVSFRIVGVLGRKGAAMMGRDQDNVVLAPWTTIKYRVSGATMTDTNQSATAASGAASTATSNKVNTLSNLYPNATALYPARSTNQTANYPQPVRFTNVDQIMAQAVSEAKVEEAMKQITELLRERHRIRPGTEDDFTVLNMAEIRDVLSSTTRSMSTLLLVVALISLVVGGVGIMNIMLVSVTERTREIGLRMAVGARSHHILRQFLVEAVVLCLVGGGVGILLGRGASILVRWKMHWPTEASLATILAAVAVSAAVGVAFGFYPAWKASRLDPIEALRYE